MPKVPRVLSRWKREVLDDCTALAIRFATAGGMSGSTATDRPSGGMPAAAVAAGARAGQKSVSGNLERVADGAAASNCAELAFRMRRCAK